MSTYYVKTKGSAVCDANRNIIGANNANQTVDKNAEYIYCVAIGQDSRDPPAGVFYLQWRVVGGSYANLASTGAIKWGSSTVLVNANAVLSSEAKVTVANMTWQDGYEIEGAAASPSANLGSDYYSELQFAINCAGAVDGSTYEFNLYNSTQAANVALESGTMLTLTMESKTADVADAFLFTDVANLSVSEVVLEPANIANVVESFRHSELVHIGMPSAGARRVTEAGSPRTTEGGAYRILEGGSTDININVSDCCGAAEILGR